MDWEQLIAISRLLAETSEGVEARRISQQARLRKAISTAYYAMFHALAKSNADALIGSTLQSRGLAAWSQVYRALEHGFVKAQINRGLDAFPTEIQDFGHTFVVLQDQRHRADYDPNAEFTPSETVRLLDRAEAAIGGFGAVDPTVRKEFASYVLFRLRRS